MKNCLNMNKKKSNNYIIIIINVRNKLKVYKFNFFIKRLINILLLCLKCLK